MNEKIMDFTHVTAAAALQRMQSRYPQLAECRSAVEGAFDLLRTSYQGGGKLLLCGNGGSAADCEHIVGELMKGFMSRRPVDGELAERLVAAGADRAVANNMARQLQGALPAISLVSHSALIAAFSNDVSAELVFAQQVYGYGKPGDVVLGLSTSGNSANVLRALEVAKALGLGTIGLTGRSGGKMAQLCDVTIAVPAQSTPDVQELHLPIYHTLCMMLEAEFFPGGDAQ